MGVPREMSLRDEWIAVSDDLTDEDRESLLKEARVLAKQNILLRELRTSDRRPNPYENPSRKLSLVEFIQTEWVDKGWNPPDIERAVVSKFDPKLLKACTDYESKRVKTLPEGLRFKKNRNRTSYAELRDKSRHDTGDTPSTSQP